MTIEDLANEIKLHRYFVEEGNSSLQDDHRGPINEEWREAIRLGLRHAWIRKEIHWRWNSNGAISRGYNEPVHVYTLTEHGRDRFFNRKV